jgi:uncharacterized protein YcfJ
MVQVLQSFLVSIVPLPARAAASTIAAAREGLSRQTTEVRLMKAKACCLAIIATASAPAAAVDFMDVAPVIAVTPLYGPVADARECAPGAPMAPQVVAAVPQPAQPGVPPPPPQERNSVAPVVGGVAGALLGSQVGSGRGRDAASAVGAVAGTVIADRVANPDAPASTTGAVVGGAAGALLGNQVGQGSGRTAATAAGAIGGAMIGDRVMAGSAAPASVAAAPMAPAIAAAPAVQPCRVVDGVTREAIRGYSVVYRYAGRDITTTLPYHPGSSIRVAIGAADSMVARPAPAPAPAAYGAPPAGYAPPPPAYAPPPPGYAPPGYAPYAQPPAQPQQPVGGSYPHQ